MVEEAPGDHGLRLDDDERIEASGPDPGELGPEDTIGGPDARSLAGSLVDPELMSEGMNLDLHGGAGPKLVPEERCDEEDELEHSEMVHWWPPKGRGRMATSMVTGRSSLRDARFAADICERGVTEFSRSTTVKSCAGRAGDRGIFNDPIGYEFSRTTALGTTGMPTSAHGTTRRPSFQLQVRQRHPNPRLFDS